MGLKMARQVYGEGINLISYKDQLVVLEVLALQDRLQIQKCLQPPCHTDIIRLLCKLSLGCLDQPLDIFIQRL